MFVIELVYKVDLATIDAEMRAHVAWLRTHYAAGTFLASGRKEPSPGDAASAPSPRAIAAFEGGELSDVVKRRLDACVASR